MSKFFLACIMLFMALSLDAVLPTDLSVSGNPELFSRLKDKAISNLQKLPTEKAKAYRHLLADNNNIVMAYLIAYEQDSKLAESDSEVLESNYKEIVNLLDNKGLQYSPEFFLSYVARQSVSDERLSAYRKAMLEDGLDLVLEIADPLERYRACATWCVEKLQFKQTSGRDQNPLDITQKSLVGRCEEMQILFVAAARTVGLPSRPASTPWWAHMDNNHAWAEVYLDDEWHYTGDMDAAYFPDQTWFSGMIDKTVMILAEGSLAAADDEVLVQGRYDTIINSTPNYARERTRRVDAICIDINGNPVADATINVMVYNWGALRSIISLKSNEHGTLGFSAGSGDFYLSAYKEGKHALKLVKASEMKKIAVELILSDEPITDIDVVMQYPANEMVWREAPAEYRTEIEQRKTKRQNAIDSWLMQAKSSTVEDSIAILFRGNLNEFEKFWQHNKPVEEEYLDFLRAYDPKFLWQADADLFEAVYRFWRSHDRDMPAELFSPSVFYEELPKPYLSKKHASLYPKSFVHKNKDTRKQVQKALKWQKRKYKIDSSKALSGLPRMDIMAQQKYLSDTQYRILAIYILRANGIPADFTRLPNHIMVYLDEDWHYYNLKDNRFNEEQNHNSNLKSKIITITDDNGIPVLNAVDHLTPTRYVDGLFYNINADITEHGGGRYEVEIAQPDIQLNFGYRISNSETAFMLITLSDTADTLNIVAERYPRTWEPADEDFLLIMDESTLNEAQLVILGNHDQENSLRVLQKVMDLGMDYHFYGYTQQSSWHKLRNYEFSPTWQSFVRDDPSLASRTITLYKHAGVWKKYEGIWERLPN
ncbi:MAG: transglutaminase-like domain-containing protein [Candidatus Cloacimonetes bacterium]|nr:transglutaminase-like domain-containing protein [Candidatus Cloacimonadota bacterium]